jgi:hypothetical protein
MCVSWRTKADWAWNPNDDLQAKAPGVARKPVESSKQCGRMSYEDLDVSVAGRPLEISSPTYRGDGPLVIPWEGNQSDMVPDRFRPRSSACGAAARSVINYCVRSSPPVHLSGCSIEATTVSPENFLTKRMCSSGRSPNRSDGLWFLSAGMPSAEVFSTFLSYDLGAGALFQPILNKSRP